MLYEIPLPKLGWTMEEAEMEEWLAQEGDAVEEGQPLFRIITEKVSTDVEATVTGTLVKIVAQVGEIIKVGDTVAVVEVPD
jgi:pyruvate/2-oxoglutarate dehydrogenase complex dihydrolipoamide acyltransferase (E2) component